MVGGDMGNTLFSGSVLAAVLIIVAGAFLVIEQQETEAAVIGLPELSSGVKCPGEEMILGWGESASFALASVEHEVGVLSISRPLDGHPEVTLRLDGSVSEHLAAGRRVLLRGGTLQYLSFEEQSEKAILCVIPSE